MRLWIAQRRADWFAGKSCLRCGTDLQLDHIDSEQKVDHRIWSWSAERREVELAKCQVLCEPCHKWKTEACDENRKHRLLDDGDVQAIRAMGHRMTQVELGHLFGVHRTTIQAILYGETYRMVPDSDSRLLWPWPMPRKAPNIMKGLYVVSKRKDGWHWRCPICKDRDGPYPDRWIAEFKAGGHFFFVCGREKRALIDSPLLDMIARDG